ncbi:uncharacterized protein LOC123439785 [Hordeum vulgare subsp. vulgare]|uniref:uncharacterized protein LOC123439785 n=1 Tax=Hordeum vulgare subsp. vulgare TaxID=112509 RepID=UPI001D1A5408|nr:uncharacterized protein LOC123439785 [Hordeum vulgare subsp. vulgare]
MATARRCRARRSSRSAIDERALAPELPSGPCALQGMGSSPVDALVCSSSGANPPSAGERRLSSPLNLFPARERRKGKPDRRAPPVCEASPACLRGKPGPDGAAALVRFPPKVARTSRNLEKRNFLRDVGGAHHLLNS